MAISYGTLTPLTVGSAASATATLPPGLTAGQLVRIDVWLAGAASACAPVAVSGGYSPAAANPQQASTAWTMWTFSKIATAGETSPIVSWTGARVYAILVSTRSGIDQATPVDTSAGAVATTSPLSSGIFTPTGSGKTADVVAGVRNSSATQTWTPDPATIQQATSDAGSAPNRHAWIGTASPPAAATSYNLGLAPIVAAAAITLVLNAATPVTKTSTSTGSTRLGGQHQAAAARASRSVSSIPLAASSTTTPARAADTAATTRLAETSSSDPARLSTSTGSHIVAGHVDATAAHRNTDSGDATTLTGTGSSSSEHQFTADSVSVDVLTFAGSHASDPVRTAASDVAQLHIAGGGPTTTSRAATTHGTSRLTHIDDAAAGRTSETTATLIMTGSSRDRQARAPYQPGPAIHPSGGGVTQPNQRGTTTHPVRGTTNPRAA